MASPSPSRRGRRHDSSRHRFTSSSNQRSRDRIPNRSHRSREFHVRRGRSRSRSRSRSHDRHRRHHNRSRDRHSRRHHEYSSRPSRSTRNSPLKERNQIAFVRKSPLDLYKQFLAELDVNTLPEEAHRLFESDLRVKKEDFFYTHKDDPRLNDLYHPSHIEIAIQKRNEDGKKAARDFFRTINDPLMILEFEPPQNDERILNDLNLARHLIAKFDAEKGIEENLLLSFGQDGFFAQFVHVRNPDHSIRTLVGIELLNVVITYLWRVHKIHYYKMIEVDKSFVSEDVLKNLPAAELEHKLDSVWKERLQATDRLLVSLKKEKVECFVTQNLRVHYTVVTEDSGDGHRITSYVCEGNSCVEVYKTLGQITTHIHDQHSELVEVYSAQIRQEIYWENYMNDPFAPCDPHGG
ncbi:hypothetical protein SUGI_0526470 [Cryptomeria japonica]|uniref:serrate RNA effector molecule-like n=1 Tax=Cryptomeria japonica TaxID=3369 RepID=UPI002408DE22|nr:serrate RNA effector molecule-like [Cryptomeria japonica]GLJ26904.1 hypothetical protein SUGI_0526470 [Cryptomeria japonica]